MLRWRETEEFAILFTNIFLMECLYLSPDFRTPCSIYKYTGMAYI